MDVGTRVLRHESELGRWELLLRPPDRRLSAFVGEYQGYVESVPHGPLRRQQVPTSRLPLILNLGSPWSVADSADEEPELHDSFFAGLFDRSVFVAADGPATCIQVDFTPLGAHMFLGLPMDELANRTLGLEDLLPGRARELPAQLAAKRTWDERFALLDDVFAAGLAGAQTPPADIAWAWNALVQTNGRAPIGWICDRLGRSRRYLATRFREQIGLPPKTVARILRFDRAFGLLERGDVSLAQLAFECGYYDQAHLTRDFREFAGTSPAKLSRRLMPDGGVIA